MAERIERRLREELEGLPADHPDRRFIEGILGAFEGYNARVRLGGKEIPVEVKRFSPEAREALEKEVYVVYELTGQSIRSLREAGRRFWSVWHNNHPEFEALTSRVSEVAINPEQLFLPGSNWKTLPGQERLVADFSKKLARKVKGIEAVVGEAADYSELYFTHLDATGEHLFGEKYGYNYARTKTPVGSYVALVGGANSGDGLDVYDWSPGSGSGGVFAAPLVVPA